MSSTSSLDLFVRTVPKELLSRTVTDMNPTATSFLTPDRILLMNNMSSILAGVSLIFCLVVLGFTALVATNKESRKCLDRVSFRLIVYSLISNCIYCVGYIICVKVPPGFWCVAGVWMIQFWLGITNCLIMFIALNLQFVLVHMKNGITLEKYYLIITVVLNLGTTLPPLIKGKFGWDPIIKVCWLTSDNDRDRLIWQFCTQLMWIILTVLVTAVSACITICAIYKHKFTALKLLRTNQPTDTIRSQNSAASSTRRRGSAYSVLRGATKSLLSNSDFRRIVLRISLYPIVMIILNVVITVADIRISTANGIYDPWDYGLYVVYYALYGARGIFYALIAVLDPALIRGFRVWRGIHGFSTGSSENLTGADAGGMAEANKFPNYVIEAKQRAQFGGINVQTHIETFIDKDNEDVDPLDGSAMHMTQIRNINVPVRQGPTTVIEHGQHITLPPTAIVTTDHEETDKLDDLPSVIAHGRLSRELNRMPIHSSTRPGWAGFSFEERDNSIDGDFKDGDSTTELATQGAEPVTPPPFGPQAVEHIRFRQRQRSIARKEVETRMKRQI